MSATYLHTNFRIHSRNGPLVISVALNENVRTAAMLSFYVLQKTFLNIIYIFFEAMLPHTVSDLYVKYHLCRLHTINSPVHHFAITDCMEFKV